VADVGAARGAAGADEDLINPTVIVIDAAGAAVQAATRVSDSHISGGDDAVVLGGRALFVTGEDSSNRLVLDFVAGDLTTEAITLP
jgi:hypothetical protein